jgi:hypothetical protein
MASLRWHVLTSDNATISLENSLVGALLVG